MTSRRSFLFATGALCVPLPFIACSGADATTSLALAKTYGDDLANALSAAAQAYLAGTPAPSPAQAALVSTAVSDLQTARAALDAATVPANAVQAADEVIAVARKLSPIVSPYLGPAAPYLPLALGVLQAFVDSLPPPPATPAVPPAGLHIMAAKYHRS